MDEIPLLRDIITIFGLSIAVLLVCARLHVPTVVGLLFTGVISGPHGFRLIKGLEEVEVLAGVGVVLLLFTIGLELSLKQLVRIKKQVFFGGLGQVIMTVSTVAFLTHHIFGADWGPSLFNGFLVSASSTAIVLKLLQDRAQIQTPHGQLTLAILIFQDIAVIPMMLVTPFLTGSGEAQAMDLLVHLGKGIFILLAVLLAAQKVVPWLLFQIARTRNSQLFLLSVLFLCFSVAWLTANVGLSLALGAFLSGLIIAESDYSHHAVGHILPFQQIFTSFFFVSVGMLLDVNFVMNNIILTISATIAVIILKSVVVMICALLLGYSLRVALLTGLALCQVGEFAFILASAGTQLGLVQGADYQLFLAVSLLTMVLTPLLIACGPGFADRLLRWGWPARIKRGSLIYAPPMPRNTLKDHVVIIGFGVCGRNLAWAADLAGIPYGVIEMNPETVRTERKKGRHIVFGDATQVAVLEQVNVKEARIVVIAVNDPIAGRRMVEMIREESPKVYIAARTRYVNEMQPMIDLGADDVIPEEFETSVEIFTRVLRKYLIPHDEIERFVTEVRSRGYQVLRRLSQHKSTLADLKLNLLDSDIGVYRVAENSPLIGKTLLEADVRRRFGVTILMIRRDLHVMSSPAPNTMIKSQDLIIVFGKPNDLFLFSETVKG